MTDWIHCNKCFVPFQKEMEFQLTHCGHIFCPNCLNKCKQGNVCLVCQKPAPTMVPLSKTMPEDIKVFFKEPTALMDKSKQVCEFQFKNYRELVQHLTNKYRHAKNEAIKQYRMVMTLKRENCRLKELMRQALGQHPTSTPRNGATSASTFMNDVSMSSVGRPSTSMPFRREFSRPVVPNYPRRVSSIDNNTLQGTNSPMQFVPVHRANHLGSNSSTGLRSSMHHLTAGSSRLSMDLHRNKLSKAELNP